MKIFVIKGNLKGMVKIDSKMHLVGDGFDIIDKVILFDGITIKVIDKRDFGVSIVGYNAKDIVLLGDMDKILGNGSLRGKADVNKIMLEYNKLPKRTKVVDSVECEYDIKKANDDKVITDKMVCKEETEKNLKVIAEKEQITPSKEVSNICDNTENHSKIDINFQKQEDLTTEKETDYEFVSNNLEYISDNVPLDNDMYIDNQNYVIKNSCENENNIQEIILSKDDDIDSGVDFIMQNLNKNANSDNYYSQIKENLDKFLNSHPKNEELENKVWGSKWVKVNGDYDYSVGVIFEDNVPSIIAYAIPYEDFSQIDTENLKFGEWLKISEKDNENRGYFIYYQNAQTGEMLIDSSK